jgi:hypothetical protein
LRAIGWGSLALSIASLALCIAAWTEARGYSLGDDRFPVEPLGEGVTIMVLPIVLTLLAAVGAVTSRHYLDGKLAAVGVVVSAIVIWKLLGVAGFQHLF